MFEDLRFLLPKKSKQEFALINEIDFLNNKIKPELSESEIQALLNLRIANSESSISNTQKRNLLLKALSFQQSLLSKECLGLQDILDLNFIKKRKKMVKTK